MLNEEKKLAEAAEEAANAVAEEVTETAEAAVDTVSEKAAEAAEAVEETAEVAAEEAAEAVEAADKVAEKAEKEAAKAAEKAEKEAKKAQKKAEKAAKEAADAADNPEKAARKRRRKTRLTALGILLLLLALIIAGTILYMRSHIMLVTPTKKEPYFNEGLMCYGYDGYGSVTDATAAIKEPLEYQIMNYEALYADIFGLSRQEVRKSGMFSEENVNKDFLFKDKTAREFASYFHAVAKDGTGLSNGDSVTVVVTADSDKINAMPGAKHTFNAGKTASKTYLVTGLHKPTVVIDPFESVYGVYQTEDGETTIDVDPTYRETFDDFTIFNPTLDKALVAGYRVRSSEDKIAGNYDFTADWTQTYKAGDTVTVRCVDADLDASTIDAEANYVILDDGVVLAPAVRDFQVLPCTTMVSGRKEVQDPSQLLMAATSYAKAHFGSRYVLADVWTACPKKGNKLKKSDYKNFAAVLVQADGSWKNLVFTDLQVDGNGNIVNVSHTPVLFQDETVSYATRQNYINYLIENYGSDYAFTHLSLE